MGMAVGGGCGGDLILGMLQAHWLPFYVSSCKGPCFLHLSGRMRKDLDYPGVWHLAFILQCFKRAI